VLHGLAVGLICVLPGQARVARKTAKWASVFPDPGSPPPELGLAADHRHREALTSSPCADISRKPGTDSVLPFSVSGLTCLTATALRTGQATLVRRDTGSKEATSIEGIVRRARDLLAEIQRGLRQEADAFRVEHTLEDPSSYEVMREFLDAAGGFAVAHWCGSTACEERMKTEARATIHCLPLHKRTDRAACIV
jgi:hypothetical protein